MNLSDDNKEQYSIVSETCKETEFTKIYEMYADDIYRLCFSFVKNQMDAEDAVQETFLKYFYSGKKFENTSHIKAWLIVTASNHCKNILKHWWGKRQSLDCSHDTGSREYQIVDEMMELVMELPEKYKTTIYLYYYEGYNSKEIAKLLQKPDSTIRTYLQKAKKLLKKQLV